MLQKNKIIKLLGISFLAFVLGFSVACGNGSSSETSSSSEKTSSEPSSNSSSDNLSSETPAKDPVYKIKVGEIEYTLTKGQADYSITFESVTAGTEIKFYKDDVEIYPGCASLGNNVTLTADFKTIIHNNASNVTLNLKVSNDGAEVWMTGYETANISEFSAKVNGEDANLTVSTAPTGYVASLKITLAIKDVLVIYGDGNPLYIGDNAMHYETEYTASLPGEYIINVNEYNRLIITEPVLEVDELYLTYVNDQLITPTFETVMKDGNRAEFYFSLEAGDEFIVKYIDGTTLGSGKAVVKCDYRIYINSEGNYYPVMENIKLNITATMDGEELTLESRPLTDNNLAVYTINVEAGKTIQFFNDGIALKYQDSSETSFTYEEAGTYTIYINSSLQVWDQPYVPVVYKEITVTGVDSKLLENRNIYIWAWSTNQDGAWVDELAKVNIDGTITVYVPEGADNFLLITTFADKGADWNNVKSQTNDIKVTEATSITVTWKTKEDVSGSSSNNNNSTSTGIYGLRGSFDGGDDWATTKLLTKVNNDVYELEITATKAAEFKVVIVKADDPSYIETWIGNNGEANFQIQPGTYKVTYTVSTGAVTITNA